MFSADARTTLRVAPHIQRVLIVEQIPDSAKLLAELMQQMGSRECRIAPTGSRALELLSDYPFQVILTEFAGPDLDGLDLTQRLRHSTWPSRKAPVIMVTAEATQASITGARNAGAHEFLRKPYTAGDLFRRIENVVTKPRPWIEAVMYVGPDRRRFNSGEFAGSMKRRSDAFQAAQAAQAS